jgi:hypothetical protein
MPPVGIRAGAVVLALTMLIGVVAIAGREPLRGALGRPTGGDRRTAQAAPTPVPLTTPGAQYHRQRVSGSTERSAGAAWLRPALAALGLAALLAAGVLLVRRLPGRSRAGRHGRVAAPAVGRSPDDDAAPATRAVEAATASLRGSADPRSGVIEAYARLEHVLAEHELGRGSSEAPREYLARVLRAHGAPERSLSTLTSLFEEARFSRHPVSEAERRRALGALEEARSALSI